ncbi:MAG: guanylate kinase [Actinobacteria bacterium]|nr:guanylate kinase [Actinomycetota bacterium]MCL5885546.1 guanylate kinase [Actinomycetota bacterium]
MRHSNFEERAATDTGKTENDNRLIVVLCGPGGVGKGTVARLLVARDQSLWLSRSWTTRSRREGEPEDAYYFVSKNEFMSMADKGGFMEWAQFLGNLYGTPWPDRLPTDSDILLEIDVQGATQIRKGFPDSLVILLLAPSRDEQRKRLQERGDSKEHVDLRMREADTEIAFAREFADAIVINDSLDRAVSEIGAIIDNRRLSRSKMSI